MSGLTQRMEQKASKAREPSAEESAATTKERLRRQRMRSIAIAVSLALLVALFYAATIVRLGGNALNKPY